MKRNAFAPTRRQFLELGVLAGVGIVSSFTPLAYAPTNDLSLAPFAPRVRALQAILRKQARAWFDGNKLARPDGWLYAIDVNQLLLGFVDAADRDGYVALRDFAEQNFVVNDPQNVETRGFVLWRTRAGEKRDASGTTEALRLAKALWRGAAAFARPADAELALLILDGYARHASVDQGIWFIRNYYGFGTGSFANNSFLVDYDPDFIHLVAEARDDAALHELAENSYRLIQRGVSPCGLLYDVVQPELKTIIPDIDLAVFSPNDVIQISNSATVAAMIANGLPDVARKTMVFIVRRLNDPRMYYYGRTGEAVNGKAPGVAEFSALARLAAVLGERAATATFLQRAMPLWEGWCRNPDDPAVAWITSEILSSMKAVLDLA